MKVSKILVPMICILTIVLSCDKKPSYKQAPFDGSSVVIDVRNMKEGTAEFYSLVLDGKRINFFLLKIKGTIHSFFDACLECYPRKLGFRIDGRYAVCRACNVRYPIDELRIGGCYPIRLKGSIEDGRYIIAKEDLKAGYDYF